MTDAPPARGPGPAPQLTYTDGRVELPEGTTDGPSPSAAVVGEGLGPAAAVVL
ncbi:hypothetical protein [Streptomyces sp. 8N706]|uniref:hypothetical protein n=1 Tax=Streptomyces sp. 8N706 TaxID=3457416 RepID=UPI003FD2B2AC